MYLEFDFSGTPILPFFLNLLPGCGVSYVGQSTASNHETLIGDLPMPSEEQTMSPTISIQKSALIAPLPWWLIMIVALGAALMAAGALIALLHPAMLVSPRDQINGAVRVYAGYLVSRNLALAIMLLAALSGRVREQLRILVILTAFIQLLDAGMDAFAGRWTLVPGVLLLAIAFFITAAWLSRTAAPLQNS